MIVKNLFQLPRSVSNFFHKSGGPALPSTLRRKKDKEVELFYTLLLLLLLLLRSFTKVKSVHQQPCAVPSNAPCSFFLLLMLLVLYFLVQQQPCADVLSLNYSWRLRPLLTKICWLFGLLSFDRNQLQC